jgi:hypothetical protein
MTWWLTLTKKQTEEMWRAESMLTDEGLEPFVRAMLKHWEPWREPDEVFVKFGVELLRKYRDETNDAAR